MNPAINFYTSRRRKLENDEVSIVYGEPLTKTSRITINEKDLNAEDDIHNKVAAFPQNGAFNPSEVRHTSGLQPHHSLPMGTLLPGKGSWSQEQMDFAVHSTPPSDCHLGLQRTPYPVPQDHVESVDCVVKPHWDVISPGDPPWSESVQGSCPQCLSGESGHFHHIQSRLHSVRKQKWQNSTSNQFMD